MDAQQFIRSVFAAIVLLCIVPSEAAHGQEPATDARNPIVWADVPDPSVVRVGDAYYMTSTTMHMNPGVPVMKSENLVDWEIASYTDDILADNDPLTLTNGQDAYGEGTWASSIRYHDETFYVVTFSYTTGQTHVYATRDIENGTWTSWTFGELYHDPSLLFDDDGRVYLVYGATDIRIVELTADVRAVKQGGLSQVLIERAGEIAGSEFYVAAEGAHIHKIDGRYYIFLISWPRGGMRTELVYRSDDIAGPYEGRIALQDEGIAQGGLVDTREGDWYALLFQDHGAVGRVPFLVPVTWDDGWPVFGMEGEVPATLEIPSSSGSVPEIVTSDDFEYANDEELALEWQWNHNPYDEGWSVTERLGYLRLTNRRLDDSFVDTRNTLTQRTFGPQSAAKVVVDVTGMKDGDYAGVGLLQEAYGFVGVETSDGSSSIVMVNGGSETPVEVESVPIDHDVVYLGVEANFRGQADRASFYYSLDGEEWTRIGNTLAMSYDLSHFMGYRFALFTYGTKQVGGIADFDYFRIGESLDALPTGTSDTGMMPRELDLENYPDPFSTTTEIGYQVVQAANVRIDVFDTTGRRVRTLVDRYNAPGYYTVMFDAADLSSGVYLYRLQTDKRVATRSMGAVR